MEKGRRLDVAWEAVAPNLESRDRPWVQEAVFGTLRFRGRIDHLLGLHLRQGVESTPTPLLNVLRLALYQLRFMDGVPAYAAVSQAVEQARQVGGRGGAGVVNAVLRAVERVGGGEDRFPTFAEDPVGHLTTWGSHPRWLVERWVAGHGAEEALLRVEAGNRIPALHLRPIGVTLDEAARRLEQVGIGSSLGPEGSGTLRLHPGSSPEAALAAVPSIVQDPAAGWVVAWVGPVTGLTVADLCAAPGGKGIALAGLGATLLAADPSRRRLRRMGAALDRVGLPRRMMVARGEDPAIRAAEIVLLDVPCSGTGTLARHPDARWRIQPGDLGALARLQSGILEGAAEVVPAGGLLVYATCTLEPEENEERVEAFLRDHPEFIVEEGGGVPEALVDGGFLRVQPRPGESDGAFAARLRRRG